MRINGLKLYNYRLFDKKTVSFEKGINVIYGDNAIGKTTILEAVYYLSLTKSFKTNDEQTLVRHDSNEMSVIGQIFKQGSVSTLKVIKDLKGKTVFKDSSKFLKISDFIGESLVVAFCNHDVVLLNGSPRERRKLFEPIFCQISKDYVLASNYYKKILNERNALLKRLMFENNQALTELLKTLDLQLVDYAKKIIFFRNETIKKINEQIQKFYCSISEEKCNVEIQYSPSSDYQSIERELFNRRDEDIKKGTTSVGPHRDDYVFIINNKNIIDFGSQGQQRSVLISLKLCFVDLIFKAKEEYPILLLDDVLSELDRKRQNNLFNLIDSDIQTILSTATLAEVDENVLKNANIITLKKEM